MFSSLTRLDGLAIGAAVAAWDRPVRLLAWSGPTALLAVPVLLIAMQVLAPMATVLPGPVEIPRGLLVAGLLGGLLWVVIHAPLGLLAHKAFDYLGRISYGLYVFHGFMYALSHTWELRWPSRLVVAFTLTLAAAAVSYRLLERPFLGLKGRFTYVRSAPL